MVTFIVLHYISLDDTIKCVESIKNVSVGYPFSIVIVDNGSPNNTGKDILSKYGREENVKVVLSEENLGFSKGNNLGCRIAREHFQPDFLFVVNNDVFFEDKDTLPKIYKLYDTTAFDVAGPYIWNTVKKYNQNPKKFPANLNEVEKSIRELEKGLKILRVSAVLYYIYSKRQKEYATAFGLNGAALIFSKKYFERFDQVFAEQTFLYGEECLLTYRAIKYDLKLVYGEGIKVYHNHSSSTRKTMKSFKKKWTFQNTYNLKSKYRLYEIFRDNLDI